MDAKHTKHMHSFQTKAQAAVHMNPNSPQKWQSSCILLGRVPQTLKEAGNGRGVAANQQGSSLHRAFSMNAARMASELQKCLKSMGFYTE